MRMRTGVAVVVLVLLARAASAQHHTLTIEPPVVTRQTPVTLIVTERDTCPPAPVVTRVGNSISIVLGDGRCPLPFVTVTHRIEMGTLDAGDYEVHVVDSGLVVASTQLTVHAAAVTVRPSAGRIQGGSTVLVSTAVPQCFSNPRICAPPVITFDGIPATDVEVIDEYTSRAVTPPHAAGVVDVRVNGIADVHADAFRYFDPAQPPDPAVFERVLFPVLYDGPGRFGTQWATEVSLRNDGFAVEPWNGPTIPAHDALIADLGQAPNGRVLHVPREAAPTLRVGMISRETSRDLHGWGTELPVAREDDFRRSLELMNVPFDSR